MDSYKVRFITGKDDDLKTFFATTMAKVKWRLGLEDVNSMLACDPTGLFVGELNGKPISTLALLKYDPTYCLFTCYVVEEELRGKGYGMQLYKTGLKTLSPSHNIAGYAVDEVLPKYEERSGFQGQWSTSRYDLHLPTAAKILNQIPPSDFYRVQTINQIDMQALFTYDEAVFGYQRQTFLQTFLRTQGSHSRVAINEEDQIVGYTSARVAFIKEQGYRLGPLYADSLEIAQVLLKALFEEMLEKGMSSSHSVLIDVPLGKNAEGKKLIELLDGTYINNLTFMTTKGIPKGRFQNWFAIVSGEIG